MFSSFTCSDSITQSIIGRLSNRRTHKREGGGGGRRSERQEDKTGFTRAEKLFYEYLNYPPPPANRCENCSMRTR